MTELTTVANKPPIVVMRERFEVRKNELKNALPPDVSPDAFIRAFITSAQLNPELQACTWQSLWDAALRACRDGLLPDGSEAAVVPFKSRAQYIRMYGGVLRQFRRSGQFKWLKTDVVREGEKFEHWVTQAGEHFLHVPGDDFSAPIVKAYALATTKDGGEFCAVMSRAEIEKHRSYSRAQRDDAPWKTWFEAMAQKTAILKLAKVLPNARDLIGDEDEDAPPDIPIPTIEHAPRPATAAAALDQFASSPGVSGDKTTGSTAVRLEQPPDEPVSEQGAPIGADHLPPSEGDPAAAQDQQHWELVEAYTKGKNAKAAGHQRKAMPPQYRDEEHQRQASAWIAGWDGKPMPEWKASQ